MCENSFAWLISVQGNPPASVPKAIFTPASIALRSDRAETLGISAQITRPSLARGSATYAPTVSVGQRKIFFFAINLASSGRIEIPCSIESTPASTAIFAPVSDVAWAANFWPRPPPPLPPPPPPPPHHLRGD